MFLRAARGRAAMAAKRAAGAGAAAAAPAAKRAASEPPSVHLVPEEQPVKRLECRAAFEQLTPQERRYVLHISRACWAGAVVCLRQASAESPRVFCMLQLLFGDGGLDHLLALQPPPPGLPALLRYAALFYHSLGNHYATGDLKFVPHGCTEGDLAAIIDLRCAEADRAAAAEGAAPRLRTVAARLREHWEACRGAVWSLRPEERAVGFPPEGRCSYYSDNVTAADVRAVKELLATRGGAWAQQEVNSALELAAGAGGRREYTLRVASAAPVGEGVSAQWTGVGGDAAATLTVVCGDHAAAMRRVVRHLRDAIPHAANPDQTKMLERYIEHFTTGDVAAHVASQRHWVDDKSPAVEAQVGFIEPYRDPACLRGEWQGTVAVVNKATSAKFGRLVDAAERFLALFPWPRGFEKDAFSRPDFNAVEVLAFGSTHVWAGQNLPNYDSVRQAYGFKNMSYDNVVRGALAPTPGKKPSFLSDDDGTLYEAQSDAAFQVQVGVHELLGHGSGKLLEEGEDGTLNFDRAALKHPITGGAVESWYRPGETYKSKFGDIANAMEECRADACGVYLCSVPELLEVFQLITAEAQRDLTRANWLWAVRSGVVALEMYSPETKQWRQAHSRGRFAILRCLLAAGGGLVSLEAGEGPDTTALRLDSSKVESVGRPALAELLLRIHVYKSTADQPAAAAYFGSLTEVPDSMLPLRDEVIRRRNPRALWAQPVISAADGGAALGEFEPSAEGVIRSFVARYGDVAWPGLTSDTLSPPSSDDAPNPRPGPARL